MTTLTPEDGPENFARVDDSLWRGARPNLYAASWLVAAGVRTIINLEWEASDDAAFRNLPVKLVRLYDFEPLPWFAPSLADDHVVAFLCAQRAALLPVYVHCRSGQNRTGVAVAAYRLLELADPVHLVLNDFASYRGAWAWGDERYIKTLPPRRTALMARVTGAPVSKGE